MITPQLEKLILCGKASYNTFTIGGSQKSVLNVTKDRFIIITDLTIHHNLDLERLNISDNAFDTYMKNHMLTQLCIFSDRSFNQFLVRNQFNFVRNDTNNTFHVLPFGSTKFDTYLVHNTDVSFSWAKSYNAISVVGNTPATSVGRPVPFDYGKEGESVRAVGLQSNLSTVIPWLINQGGTETQTNNTSVNQLQYPVTDETRLINTESTWTFPIVNIGYVEILGEINNISATI